MQNITAYQFFEALFPNLNGEFIEIRKLPSKKQVFCLSIDEAVEAVNDTTENVYFGVATRSDQKGDKAHTHHLNVLWADIDVEKDFGGDWEKVIKIISAFELPPSIATHSGHGLHLYWLLREKVKIETGNIKSIESNVRGLAQALGGDLECADVSRIMRVPGTLNLKNPTKPVLSKIVQWHPHLQYDLSYFDPFATFKPTDNGKNTTIPAISDQAIPNGQRNVTLASLAGTMRRRGMTEKAMVAALRIENAAKCIPPLQDSVVRAIAHSIARYQPENPIPINSTKTYTLSDDGNADRIVDQHGQDIRHCFELGWLVWNEHRWTQDKTGEIRRKAVQTVKNIAFEAAKEEDTEKAANLFKHAGRCLSDSKIKAMLSSAESKLPLPVLIEDFDRNPWLLNLLNGTLDLHTRELQPHRREDLLLKLAPVEYDSEAKCPIWLSFLNRIMDGNQNLINFLQKAIGYSLTGSTAEECAFLPYGIGANGKSTLLETIEAALGDYAAQIPTEALMIRRNDGGSNDIAALRGARFVTAIETEDGRRLAEAKLKQLTGGDKVSARFLYQEFFSFRPEFKMWLACNHKPIIKGTDLAIWRRIRLIPFSVQIPEDERDPSLKGPDGKLQAELPGILTWAVEGCLKWQNEKLKAPTEVQQATDGYRNESDTIGTFLDECCLIEPEAQVSSQDLYKAYTLWCEKGGEKPLTQRAFGGKFTERGFERFKGFGTTGRWGWRKIDLLTDIST